MALPALIGAAGSLIGGLMGRSSQQAANRENIKHQKEFAQNSIQWRAADAEKAGIHPVFAMGAQTHSFSPSSVGDTSMPAAMANMGQDIGRAVDVTRGQGARERAYSEAMQTLQLQRGELENTLLASQIRKLNQTQVGPVMPSPGDRYLIDGQPNSPLIEEGPMQRTMSAPEAGWQEPGAVTDTGFSRTSTGLAPVPSRDVKERIEDMGLVQIPWLLRNNLLPSISGGLWGDPPPKSALPEGYDGWSFNPIKQEWFPVRHPKWMGDWGRAFGY